MVSCKDKDEIVSVVSIHATFYTYACHIDTSWVLLIVYVLRVHSKYSPAGVVMPESKVPAQEYPFYEN